MCIIVVPGGPSSYISNAPELVLKCRLQYTRYRREEVLTVPLTEHESREAAKHSQRSEVESCAAQCLGTISGDIVGIAAATAACGLQQCLPGNQW